MGKATKEKQTGISGITSRDDYIRAVYVLGERGQKASITNLSKELGVSKPSVSEMVRHLKTKRLVNFRSYGSIALTSGGKEEAERLTTKHRTIELFLERILGVGKCRIHEEANRLEHAISDDVLRKMKAVIRKRVKNANVKVDPHGRRIP